MMRHAMWLAGVSVLSVLAGAAGAQEASEERTLAELPHWPIGLNLPESLAPADSDLARQRERQGSADLLVWVPQVATRMRAIFLVVNNTDSKDFTQHPAFREVATRHQMGILYLRRYGLEDRMEHTQTLMDHVADQTGIDEFRHAPWITLGKSSRGRFPFWMAWKFPERTIATMSYHAETPTWPIAAWASPQDQTILHLSACGDTEWGGTYAKHHRPALLNYRARTPWLGHLAVAQGVGHGDYPDMGPNRDQPFPHRVTRINMWDYMSVFVDKALQLRLPQEGFPTDGPLTLRQVDPAGGYLIEPFAIEDIFQRPRELLVQRDGLYVIDPSPQGTTSGYARIAPAADYTPPEGVPVVAVTPGMSPTQWLLAKGLNFSLEADPMLDVRAYADLRPTPGQEIQVEGRRAVFMPIAEGEVGTREGQRRGINMRRLGFRGRDTTLLGYTVLDVREPQALKVAAFHSLAVRLQVVLNGTPVAHNQVVQLSPGLYPMLFVQRTGAGVMWGECEPGFVVATPEEVEEARQAQVVRERLQAEFEARRAQNRRSASFIHRYNDVPAEQRAHMLWIADEEQARAWLKLHDPAGRQRTD